MNCCSFQTWDALVGTGTGFPGVPSVPSCKDDNAIITFTNKRMTFKQYKPHQMTSWFIQSLSLLPAHCFTTSALLATNPPMIILSQDYLFLSKPGSKTQRCQLLVVKRLRKKTLLTDLLTCGQKPCSAGSRLGNYDTLTCHLIFAHFSFLQNLNFNTMSFLIFYLNQTSKYYFALWRLPIHHVPTPN